MCPWSTHNSLKLLLIKKVLDNLPILNLESHLQNETESLLWVTPEGFCRTESKPSLQLQVPPWWPLRKKQVSGIAFFQFNEKIKSKRKKPPPQPCRNKRFILLNGYVQDIPESKQQVHNVSSSVTFTSSRNLSPSPPPPPHKKQQQRTKRKKQTNKQTGVLQFPKRVLTPPYCTRPLHTSVPRWLWGCQNKDRLNTKHGLGKYNLICLYSGFTTNITEAIVEKKKKIKIVYKKDVRKIHSSKKKNLFKNGEIIYVWLCSDAWKWLTQLRIYIRFRKAPTRSWAMFPKAS